MVDGLYSGYMMGEDRHGAGTLIDRKLCWRMEGIWCKNFGFIGTGVKEFNDGEVLTGKFVKNRYQEVSNYTVSERIQESAAGLSMSTVYTNLFQAATSKPVVVSALPEVESGESEDE